MGFLTAFGMAGRHRPLAALVYGFLKCKYDALLLGTLEWHLFDCVGYSCAIQCGGGVSAVLDPERDIYILNGHALSALQ
jgi:hypothetical protein